MTDYIRRLVSGPKARFKDPSLNLELDLVYITPQIIIMGYPADGFESLYRNRRADAKRFLDARHGKDYWVFNLCPLRENGYEKSVFEGRVTRFPFPDHHAPPLALLPLVTREMHAWLDGSKDRVAVIHCKAGKGRSGTVACSYLLTLASPSPPPSNHLSPPAALEAAESKTQDALDQIPENLTEGDKAPRHTDALHKPTSDSWADTAPLDPDSAVAQIPQDARGEREVVANKERGFVDALKGVLDLHTAMRMKPVEQPSASNESSGAVSPVSSAGSGNASGEGAKKVKKQKQGVSIPSQRRYLNYWALILNGDAPKDVFDIYEPPSTISKPKPLVRITQIRVKMREPGGVKLKLVRAANVVLDKASEYRNKDKKRQLSEVKAAESQTASGISSATSTESQGTSTTPGGVKQGMVFASGANKLWASIARYDDELVEFLEKWERRTRSKYPLSSGTKEGESGDKTELGEMDGELKALFDEHGKWDKEKMVRSFARFAVANVNEANVGQSGDAGSNPKQGTKEEKVVHEYVLKLASDKRVHKFVDSPALKEEGKTVVAPKERKSTQDSSKEDNQDKEESPEINVEDVEAQVNVIRDREGLLVYGDEDSDEKPSEEFGASSISSSAFTSGHSSEPLHPQIGREELGKDGLVVEASREVRVKLYVGQVFIGWTWFIPTFHMPQPPPTDAPFSSDTTTATLHLTRKDLDFPLGLGTAIVDVDIDMEWVQDSSSLSTNTILAPKNLLALKGDAPVPLGKVTAELQSASIDSETGRVARVVQAVNALQGAGAAGTGGGVKAGGVREAVEVGQARGV